MFPFIKSSDEDLTSIKHALVESVFEIGDVPTVLFDTHGHVAAINPAFSRVFGYAAADIIGQPASSLASSGTELLELLTPRAPGSRAQPKPVDKVLFADSKGSLFEAALHGCEVVTADGNRLGYVALIHDLRLSRRMSNRLEIAELRLKQALDAVDDGAWSMDTRTGVAKISSRFAAMLGMPAIDDTMLHRVQYLEQVHPADRDAVRGRQSAIAAGEIDRFDDEFRLALPQGGYRWVRNKGRVIEYDKTGRPVRASGLLRDIDERKRLELRTRETEQLFREALRAVGQTLWTTDFLADVVRIEGPLVNRLGHDGQSLILTRERFRDLVHPDDLVRSLAAWETVVETESEAYEFTGRMIDSAGENFMIMLRARVAERDSNAKPARATGFIQELTDIAALPDPVTES